MKKETNRGFFKLIALIIIAAIIASFMGYNPLVLWNEYAVPAIIWVWEVFYAIIVFVIEIIMKAVNIFKTGEYPMEIN